MAYERIQFSGTVHAVKSQTSSRGTHYFSMIVMVERGAHYIWYNVLFFGDKATSSKMEPYKPGMKVFVEAMPRFRAKLNKEGEAVVAHEVIALSMPNVSGDHERIQIKGRIGAEPRLKKSRKDVPFYELSVAVNRSKDDTAWYQVLLFGSLASAANLEKYKTGLEVLVEGKPRCAAWLDDKGGLHLSNDIIADGFPELSYVPRQK